MNNKELKDSLFYCDNIKKIYDVNPDLINVFGMNNNEDIEHTTLKALRNKNRINRNSGIIQQTNGNH